MLEAENMKMDKKNRKKILELILDFYEFKMNEREILGKSRGCFMLHARRTDFCNLEDFLYGPAVALKIHENSYRWTFATEDSLLDYILDKTMFFEWYEDSIPDDMHRKFLPNVFLGCRSLEEVMIQIELSNV